MPGRNEIRYYTIEEANQALPLVKVIVADIVRQYGEISERKERLAQIQNSRGSKNRNSDLYSEELAQVEIEIERQIEVLQGYVDEIEKLGIELKDISRGLIDFRAMLDGREVYLCWQLGEDEVSHWHELDAGFAGRQSLLAGSSTGDLGGGGFASPG